ncbi:tRNA pseudouridine(55) synthase TruB [Halanaerobium hydrogeniformans]|uniref:tRNA pseudouridine synthase B n=1 Tax=Halanaerobium hydrogeniformans TaxID=656519 RepID=E4RKT3_HALHG|nr:tRNA pseudouridine(55) synthase TruB [Halanaerobium hydrogeniformans]ADQ14753.1 tRNA pseudouridine synthase B [Halanaerobium hydrogeniformans]
MFNGTANIIKPPGISSGYFIKILRKILDEKKAGHTGTLDPAAAGVLAVCFGKATKTIPFIDDSKKSYICEMELGKETDSLDLDGKTIREDLNWNKLSEAKVKAEIMKFKGQGKQIPPMYSAIHHQGKRLYKLARKGIRVEREAREIEIYSLDILDISLPIIRFKVTVSRGCYIRSLVRDIGESLNSSAVMTFLLRTQSGPFKLENSVTIEELEEKGSRILLSPEQPLDLAKYTVKDSSFFRIENGNYLLAKDFVEADIELELEEDFLCFSEEGKFLAIAKFTTKDDYQIYQPVKVFI